MLRKTPKQGKATEMNKTIKRITKATKQALKVSARFAIVAGVPCSLFWFATSSHEAFTVCASVALVFGLVHFNATAEESR